MADTKYTYSISEDFSAGVDGAKLHQEIDGSAIASASILRVDTEGDNCDAWFDGELSGGDQTTLNGLVAAHDGIPLEDVDSVFDSLSLKKTYYQYNSSADTNVKVARDSSGNLTFLDGVTAQKTLAELAVASIFGSQYQYVENISEMEYAGTTEYVERLSIDIPDTIPAGDYRVGWSYQWSTSHSQVSFKLRVQVDDTTDLTEVSLSTKRTYSEGYYGSGFGFAKVTLTSAAHTIDLDFGCIEANVISYIKNARLEIWRVA
jgi:hypothetical protein